MSEELVTVFPFLLEKHNSIITRVKTFLQCWRLVVAKSCIYGLLRMVYPHIKDIFYLHFQFEVDFTFIKVKNVWTINELVVLWCGKEYAKVLYPWCHVCTNPWKCTCYWNNNNAHARFLKWPTAWIQCRKQCISATEQFQSISHKIL